MVKRQRTNYFGFTLIELIVVIGIIAILAAIVIVAVNPARQFAKARDTRRTSDTDAIYKAVYQYVADNGGNLPSQITGQPQSIGTAAGLLDLTSTLVPNYLSSIPYDPTQGSSADTKYTIFTNGNNQVAVAAQYSELSGTPIRAGAKNYGLKFDSSTDGVSDYVRVPNSTSLNVQTGDMTIAGWVKSYGTATGAGLFFAKDNCGEGGIYSLNSANSGSFTFRIQGSSSFNASSGSIFALNTWHHVVGVKTGTTMMLYVDGAQRATTPGLTGVTSNTVPLYFGMRGGTVTNPVGCGTNRFNGEVDDLRIYNRALSTSEITQLYTGEPVNSGLVGLWLLDEGSDQTVNDSSGTANTGTFGAAMSTGTDDPNWVDSTSPH